MAERKIIGLTAMPPKFSSRFSARGGIMPGTTCMMGGAYINECGDIKYTDLLTVAGTPRGTGEWLLRYRQLGGRNG